MVSLAAHLAQVLDLADGKLLDLLGGLRKTVQCVYEDLSRHRHQLYFAVLRGHAFVLKKVFLRTALLIQQDLVIRVELRRLLCCCCAFTAQEESVGALADSDVAEFEPVVHRDLVRVDDGALHVDEDRLVVAGGFAESDSSFLDKVDFFAVGVRRLDHLVVLEGLVDKRNNYAIDKHAVASTEEDFKLLNYRLAEQ